MDDELLWEVILSYVGNGSGRADGQDPGAAARTRRAALLLTALKGRRPVALPADCARRGASAAFYCGARERWARKKNRGPSKNKYQISRRRSNN